MIWRVDIYFRKNPLERVKFIWVGINFAFFQLIELILVVAINPTFNFIDSISDDSSFFVSAPVLR